MQVLANLIQALIITLREGIEASLVVGLVFAYLSSSGRKELNRTVWLGAGAAAASSVAIAAVLLVLGANAENEAVEGILYIVAGLMVGSMVAWMWKNGSRQRSQLEHRLGKVVKSPRHAGAAAGLFALVFVMIVREGIETVLFLLALGGHETGGAVYNAIGGGMGLAIAAAFGLLLFKGSLRVNLRSFFSVTGVVLMLLSLKLVLSGIYAFAEDELSPGSLPAQVLGWAANSSSAYIMMALIGLPALLILRESIWGRNARPADGDRAASSRRWGIATGAAGIAIMTALGLSQLVTVT